MPKPHRSQRTREPTFVLLRRSIQGDVAESRLGDGGFGVQSRLIERWGLGRRVAEPDASANDGRAP